MAVYFDLQVELSPQKPSLVDHSNQTVLLEKTVESRLYVLVHFFEVVFSHEKFFVDFFLEWIHEVNDFQLVELKAFGAGILQFQKLAFGQPLQIGRDWLEGVQLLLNVVADFCLLHEFLVLSVVLCSQQHVFVHVDSQFLQKHIVFL